MEIPTTHQEALEIWRNDPMTQWYFEQIDKPRQGWLEYMAGGGTIDHANMQYTAQETAKHFGYVSGLDFCTTFEFEGGEDES